MQEPTLSEFIAVEQAASSRNPIMDMVDAGLSPDPNYIETIQTILDGGSKSGDRTGDGTLKIPSYMVVFPNINVWFPVLESKKVNVTNAIDETLWFTKGRTNTKTLNSGIWDAWADADGELGPIYGKQWRKWSDTKYVFTGDDGAYERIQFLLDQGYVKRGSYEISETGYDEIVFYKEYDQLQTMIDKLLTDPDSRRIIVESWNVGDLMDMKLTPCHHFFQTTSDSDTETRAYDLDVHEAMYGNRPERVLDLTVHLRSSDTMLGKPFNTVGYAALAITLALMTGHAVGSFTIQTTDTHIYRKHMEGARKQIEQYSELMEDIALGRKQTVPRLIVNVNPDTKIDDLDISMYTLVDYNPKAFIKMEVSV